MPVKKKLVHILCTHNPFADPRVLWIFTSLKKSYRVKAVGCDKGLYVVHQSQDDNADIKTEQHKFKKTKTLSILLFIIKTLISKNASIKTFIIAIALLLLSPLIIFYFLLMYGSRRIYREIKKKNRMTDNKALLCMSAAFGKITNNKFIHQIVWLSHLLSHVYSRTVLLGNYLLCEQEINTICACDFDTLIAAAYLKKLNGSIKIIYDCHEFWPYAHKPEHKLIVDAFLILERSFISYADHVYTVNPKLARIMSKAYSTPIDYLYNAEPLSDVPKAESKKQAGPVKFIFQGLFAPNRGIEELVLAWEQMDYENAHLYIRGPVNHPYAKQLIDQCRQSKKYNKTLFILDPVAENNLVDALSDYDVGVIPYCPVGMNNKYCSPNKLSQYLMANIAILSNDLPFVKSFLKKNQVGLTYNSNNLSTIIQAVKALCTDSQLLDNCQNNIRKALENYNWQNEEKKLLNKMTEFYRYDV